MFDVRSEMRQNSGIYLRSLDSNKAERLLGDSSSVSYVEPGYLLFSREGALMAQPFDAERLLMSGEAVSVVESVAYNQGTGKAHFTASLNGVLSYKPRNPRSTSQLTWFNREGKALENLGDRGFYNHLSLSPDEKRVAAVIGNPKVESTDIWLLETATGVPPRFTFDTANNTRPVWSPDSRYIAYSGTLGSTGNLSPKIFRKPANGAGPSEPLLPVNAAAQLNDWSPDGQFVVFVYFAVPPGRLWMFPLSGDRKPVRCTDSPNSEKDGRFSPEGRWLAYAAMEKTAWEIYVQPVPPTGAKCQISSHGGNQPQWRRDGKELYYLRADRKLMAVEIKSNSATFEPGPARELFDAPVTLSDYYLPPQYAVADNGQRFLFINPESGSSPLPITVIVNWELSLKRSGQ